TVPFTDTRTAATAADFTGTIDWGDNTTTAGTAQGVTVTGGSGTLTVHGTHAYADEGVYTIKVALADDAPGTATATFTGTATVTPITAGGAISLTEGQAVTDFRVATFSDPGSPAPAGSYAATVDWGDGTATSGTAQGVTITGGGGNFTV